MDEDEFDYTYFEYSGNDEWFDDLQSCVKGRNRYDRYCGRPEGTTRITQFWKKDLDA